MANEKSSILTDLVEIVLIENDVLDSRDKIYTQQALMAATSDAEVVQIMVAVRKVVNLYHERTKAEQHEAALKARIRELEERQVELRDERHTASRELLQICRSVIEKRESAVEFNLAEATDGAL